jgi:two-component system, cell cycle response regulator DivK
MGAPDIAGKCVLIIEDNPLNMKLFSAMIEAQGYLLLQATDGRRGLDLARQHHPDLVIMDVNLPGMSGLEAAQRLKRNADTRDIPIIVTTAYGWRGDDEEIVASGCDDFIAKPIGVSKFLQLIETVIARASGGRGAPLIGRNTNKPSFRSGFSPVDQVNEPGRSGE